MNTKKCKGCEEVKALSEFYEHRQMKDGHLNYCKACVRARKKQHREANSDAIKESKRQYYEANREQVIAKVSAWQKANPERANASTRKWSQANPDKERAKNARRRARSRNAYIEGAYIPTYEELVTFYGKPCLYPGCENTDTTYDHIVAYNNGGLNVLLNLQPMCKSHNSGKRDHHNTDYRTIKWIDRINGHDVVYRPHGM